MNTKSKSPIKYYHTHNASDTNVFPTLDNPTFTIAKADSGASNHYWMVKDKGILLDLMKQLGPTVYLPNDEAIQSKQHGFLPIKSLSRAANKVHILPGIKNSSLLSLGQLCDDGCLVNLTKDKLLVYKNDLLVLKGFRNRNDGLWDVPLPQTQQELYNHHKVHAIIHKKSKLNVILKKSTTKSDLAQFYHACCFSPPKTTLMAAIKKGHFLGWPGFTEALI